MDRMSITSKVWLSIGVFVVGFVVSTFFADVQNRTNERALQAASESLFPATQRSQEADAAFQRMIKAFGDAVITQDASAVARAGEDGTVAMQGLRSIADIKGLSADRAGDVRELASRLEQFIRDATTLYGSALSNPSSISADTQEQMRQLAGRTEGIKNALLRTKEQFSKDLREQLSLAGERSARQRSLSLFLFCGTLIIAGIIVHLTIRRSITNVLSEAVKELKAAAAGTASAAAGISAASQAVARGSSQQAASLQEVSASGEEISSMTQRNAENSRSAAEKMSVAACQVAEANERLAEMMQSMNEIDTASDKVSKIIRTIDEIAFQTNILALNAAVEAARAGEAGMGFAVVADEVRSLAQRCAHAARDTTVLIEESTGKTKAGKAKLDQVALTIHSVTATSGDVKILVDQIQGASDEQARGMNHISTALSQMEEVTDNNASGAKESAAAAEALSSQSRAMEAIIARLVGMVEGSRNSNGTSRSS